MLLGGFPKKYNRAQAKSLLGGFYLDSFETPYFKTRPQFKEPTKLQYKCEVFFDNMSATNSEITKFFQDF